MTRLRRHLTVKTNFSIPCHFTVNNRPLHHQIPTFTRFFSILNFFRLRPPANLRISVERTSRHCFLFILNIRLFFCIDSSFKQCFKFWESELCLRSNSLISPRPTRCDSLWKIYSLARMVLKPLILTLVRSRIIF